MTSPVQSHGRGSPCHHPGVPEPLRSRPSCSGLFPLGGNDHGQSRESVGYRDPKVSALCQGSVSPMNGLIGLYLRQVRCNLCHFHPSLFRPVNLYPHPQNHRVGSFLGLQTLQFLPNRVRISQLKESQGSPQGTGPTRHLKRPDRGRRPHARRGLPQRIGQRGPLLHRPSHPGRQRPSGQRYHLPCPAD